MGAALRAAGFEVSTAADGAEALEQWQRAPGDALVTDFVMPRVNGYQLVQSLRAAAPQRPLPVVLVSARAAVGERFAAHAGVVVLAKPFTPEALRNAVTAALAAGPPGESPDDPFAAMVAELAGFVAEPAPAVASTLRATVAPPSARWSSPPRPAASPSRAAVESAHARFTEILARDLVPAFQDVAAGGSAVSEEALLQVLRFYLSPARVAALARELRPLEAGLRGSVVLDGLVEAIPLGEVFQLLALQAQTGVLTVERGADAGGGAVRFAVRGGRIDLALARDLPREFHLGRYLVAAGAVSRAHVDAVIASLEPRHMLLGAALVTGGFIAEADLQPALQRQTAELVYEVLRWPDGRFRFEAGVTIHEAQLARLGLASEALVLEGHRRLDEWRVFAEFLPHAGVVVARTATSSDGALEALDRRVLAAVDGRRSVTEIAELLAVSAFDASKSLCRLLQGRLVALAG